MIRQLFCLVLLVGFQANVAADNILIYKSGKNLRAMYEAHKRTRNDVSDTKLFQLAIFLNGYVLGIADTSDDVCVKKDSSLNMVVDSVGAYLDKHADQLDGPGGKLVHSALVEAFPCKLK